MGLMASQGTGMMELFESPAILSNRTEQAGTCSQRLEGEERTVSFAKNLGKIHTQVALALYDTW